MYKKETKLLKISRQMTPEHQADLLELVHLAYVAETSARKLMGVEPAVNGAIMRKSQEYPCEDI